MRNKYETLVSAERKAEEMPHEKYTSICLSKEQNLNTHSQLICVFLQNIIIYFHFNLCQANDLANFFKRLFIS